MPDGGRTGLLLDLIFPKLEIVFYGGALWRGPLGTMHQTTQAMQWDIPNSWFDVFL